MVNFEEKAREIADKYYKSLDLGDELLPLELVLLGIRAGLELAAEQDKAEAAFNADDKYVRGAYADSERMHREAAQQIEVK